MTFARVSNVLEVGRDSLAILDGDPTFHVVPGAGSTDLLRIKLDTGGFSAVPEPATTKVSLYEQDPIFIQFKSDVCRVLNPAAVEAPVVAPVVAPRGILGHMADAVVAALAPAAPREPALPPARKNVTKDVLCRTFDVEASLAGETLIIVYNGERYDMTDYKVANVVFERR
jgi:hypothetical protein